jgi:hypothetical protein
VIPGIFAWQEEYGAFTYSKEHVPMIAAFIARQEEHHKNDLVP